MKLRRLAVSSHWASYAAVASVFFAPLSASFQSISIVLTLGLVLASPILCRELQALFSKSWFISALALFILSFVASTWSLAPKEDIFIIIGKYSKLLYLPFFVVAFRPPKARLSAIHAFIAAMMITCVISFLKKLGFCHYHGDDPAFVFRKHIMTGYMMAFAVYLAAVCAAKTSNFQAKIIYVVLVCIMSYQVLFIGMGRSSYLTYFLLGGLFVIFTFSWRKCLLGLCVVFALISGIYTQSGIMQQRFHEAVYDWKAFHNQTDINTPVGFRLQFHRFAQKQFLRHPWIGHGTSGLGEAFKIEQPIPAWGTRLFEPHSQYWLVAADWGTLGLILFCAFFISLIIATWRIKDTRSIALGMIFSFLLGCFFDSLLLYAGTGYFLLLFIGLSLGAEESSPNMTCNQTDSLDHLTLVESLPKQKRTQA